MEINAVWWVGGVERQKVVESPGGGFWDLRLPRQELERRSQLADEKMGDAGHSLKVKVTRFADGLNRELEGTRLEERETRLLAVLLLTAVGTRYGRAWGIKIRRGHVTYL